MKVLHINTAEQGGAAWCAIRINKALIQEGVDTRMLFAEGNTMPEGIRGCIAERDKIIWNKNWILKKIRNQLAKFSWYMDVEKMQTLLNAANKHNFYLSHPLSDYKNIAHHPLVEWADIIHLHWVPDFVDYPTFFGEVKKPMVWTLHDKYPAVGFMHYSSRFHPVPDELKELDLECRKIKREGVSKAKSLNIVAISESMVEECKNSDVLGEFPVTLIHNGVDTNVFQPCNRQNSRKELGLIADAKIFLFSSYFINDPNKGLNRVINAVEKVNVPNKMLVCVGNIPLNYSVPEASFPIIVTGMVSNQTKLSQYYSAADFFIQASFEETFAQTPLEAMACGVPVISTPCSGASDLIRPFNGVICCGFDSDAIATGIEEVLNNQYNAEDIRQYIIDIFRYDKVAQQYINLYESILNKC
jgi:glycosyltransferase involved in cell wall biosynthesis